MILLPILFYKVEVKFYGKKNQIKIRPSTASSWWNERTKITARKAGIRTVKAKKKVKTMKAAKAKTGHTY